MSRPQINELEDSKGNYQQHRGKQVRRKRIILASFFI